MEKAQLERANEIQQELNGLDTLEQSLELNQGLIKVDKLQLESAILVLTDEKTIAFIVKTLNEYIESETKALNEEFKNL